MNQETLANIIDDLKDGLTYGQIQTRNNVSREIVFAISQNKHLTFSELLERLPFVAPGMKSKEIMAVLKS